MPDTKRGRYGQSRRKACEQCAKAKTKCKSTEVGCTRCIQRGLVCSTSTQPTQPSQNTRETTEDIPDLVEPPLDHDKTVEFHDIFSQAAALAQSQRESETSESSQTLSDLLNSSSGPAPSPWVEKPVDVNSELTCTINAKEIRNRWLNAFAPEPGHTTKEYPKHVVTFISQILKAYTANIVRGPDLPPFLHPYLLDEPAIYNCLDLVQTCARLSGFTVSLLASVLEEEINKKRNPEDTHNLRSEFQANLMYLMVLHFCYKHDSDVKALFRRGIVNLQELACISTETGVVCLAEREGACPRWETWIAAETQRRSLYLMYMFDNLLSARDGLQTFLGTELRGLPAPCPRELWYAANEREWKAAYEVALQAGTVPGISIDDLWPDQSGMSDIDAEKRRKRVDRWLEGVDEFGTMLYAVTCCTHGS